MWENMLPMQGKPAYDDIRLDRQVAVKEGGPDPEKEDRVMLKRNRVSRIYFDQKFFDYPISLKWETFKNLGLKTDIIACVQLSGFRPAQAGREVSGGLLYQSLREKALFHVF